MAIWDSAYLLAKFIRDTNRPTAVDEIASATYYTFLSEAQDQVVAEIASRFPAALIGAPAALSSSDGGYTFGFGTDPNGYPIAPMGKVKIYSSLAAIPDFPWAVDSDYLQENELIRIPGNQSYTGPTLYWRGITPPGAIDGSGTKEPVLLPAASRELISAKAMVLFGEVGGGIRQDIADTGDKRWAEAFPRWMLVWRTQFRSGGALGPGVAFNRVIDPAYLDGDTGILLTEGADGILL